MKKLKVLYFSDCGPENTVFNSQVMGMVKAWKTVSDVTLIYRSSYKAVTPSADNCENIKCIRSFPNLGRIFWKLELLNSELENIIDDFDIVHCRGAIATYQALLTVKNDSTKIIYDCRSAIIEELDYSKFNKTFFGFFLKKIRKYEYSAIEKKALLSAFLSTSVSQELSDYMFDKYGEQFDAIIPPIVDVSFFRFSPKDRVRKRQLLNIKDNSKVFIFVGASDAWQRLDYLKEWWTQHCLISPNDKLVVLTHSTDRFFSYFRENYSSNTQQVVIKTVRHDEVPAYLSASDYALIFRDYSLTNRVSHPVKISEYLVSGLRVITNVDYFVKIAPKKIFLAQNINKFNCLDNNSRADIFLEKKYCNKNAIKKILHLI